MPAQNSVRNRFWLHHFVAGQFAGSQAVPPSLLPSLFKRSAQSHEGHRIPVFFSSSTRPKPTANPTWVAKKDAG